MPIKSVKMKISKNEGVAPFISYDVKGNNYDKID